MTGELVAIVAVGTQGVAGVGVAAPLEEEDADSEVFGTDHVGRSKQDV